MLNDLKIETHTVLVLDTVDNAFRLSAFSFFFFPPVDRRSVMSCFNGCGHFLSVAKFTDTPLCR